MTRTALVLGGGGITGIAWELGILRGLAAKGLDLTGADRVVGTSAGSVVGAQITSGLSIDELYDVQLEPPDAEIGAKLGRTALARLLPPMLVPGAPTTKRRRIGRVSLEAHTPGGDERVEVIRSRLGIDSWSERDLQVCAVDAENGEFVTFDRDNDVDLVTAVAASCAVPLVWPAVTIHGRHFMDGGMRSPANADVARGADVVVVLAPLPQAFSRATSIAAQLRNIRPARSLVVTPDKQALTDIGRNVLDPDKRADAARTGLRQASAVVDQVRAVWPH
jgi:NTE family protein